MLVYDFNFASVLLSYQVHSYFISFFHARKFFFLFMHLFLPVHIAATYYKLVGDDLTTMKMQEGKLNQGLS